MTIDRIDWHWDSVADYLINNPLSEQIEKETHTLLKKLKGFLKK